MKFRPSNPPRYRSVAAFRALRSLFHTSSSQLARRPATELGSGSGKCVPSLTSRLCSTAPLRVYSPTFSTSAPNPRPTKGRYSPLRARASFRSTSTSCSRMFSS